MGRDGAHRFLKAPALGTAVGASTLRGIARLEQALTDHGVSISFLVRTWEASEETASGTAEERVERAEVRASSRLPHHNLILRDVSPGSALQCC